MEFLGNSGVEELCKKTDVTMAKTFMIFSKEGAIMENF